MNVIIMPSVEIKVVASFMKSDASAKTIEIGSHSLYFVVIVYTTHIPPSVIDLRLNKIITNTGKNNNNKPIILYRVETTETAAALNSQKKINVIILTSIEKAEINAPNVQNTAIKTRRVFPAKRSTWLFVLCSV